MIRRVGLLRVTKLRKGDPPPPKQRKRLVRVRRHMVWMRTREETVQVVEALQRALQESWEWPTEVLRLLAAEPAPAGTPGYVTGREETVESDAVQLVIDYGDHTSVRTTLWERSLRDRDPE